MPPIFKALVTIAVWILFVNGCLGIVLPGITRLTGDTGLGAPIAWGVGVVSLIASVVAMKLRQTLE
jgi:hypothetical protein